MPSEEALNALYASFYSDESIASDDTTMISSEVSLEAHADYLARDVLGEGARVLDFGAGLGTLVKHLADRGFEVEGVEPSASAREAVRRQHGFHFHADSHRLEKGRYDAIAMIEAVEHLAAPWQSLQALGELLAPGGTLYITTPNRDGLQARLHGVNWREAVAPTHLVLFNFASLSRLLRACGFSDIRMIRFSPLTTRNLPKRLLHRLLQAVSLYGGLRVCAKRR